MGLLATILRGKEVDSLIKEVDTLRDDKKKLKEEVEDLKLKKRLEAEEIKHMVRINEEKGKQEVENEKIAVLKKYNEDITVFKEQQRKELVESLTQFHTKMESRFSEELKNLKEVYGLLMQRLPNVNLSLTKKL